MKIGIVGLRPRQIADVQQRNIPGLQLEFYAKAQSIEGLQSFSEHVDKVILIAGHVARPLITALDSSKRLVLTGSVSALVRKLEELMGEREPEPVKEPTPEAPLETTEFSTKSPPIASDIPRGYETQYIPRDDEVLVNALDGRGRADYSILKAAEPGDTVRFARPKDLSLNEWRLRLAQTRTYYKQKFNLLMEAHFYKDFVDLFIMDPKQRGILTLNKDMQSTTPPPAPKTEPKRGFVMPAGPKEERIPRRDHSGPPTTLADVDGVGQALEDLKDKVPQHVESEQVESEEDTTATGDAAVTHITTTTTIDYTQWLERDLEFWKQVFIEAMPDVEQSKDAAAFADAAVLEYRRRSSP